MEPASRSSTARAHAPKRVAPSRRALYGPLRVADGAADPLRGPELASAARAPWGNEGAVVQARKGSSSAGEAKGKAAAQQQKGVSRAAAAPEKKDTACGAAVSGGGFGAAASPTSFTDGSNFFSSAGTFFSNAGHSPMSQPWMLPQSLDLATCGDEVARTEKRILWTQEEDVRLMWIDEAHHFYVEDNKLLKLGHFVLMDVWYVVRNEPKWITYNNGLKEARKRKTSDNGNAGEDPEHIDLDEPEECPRPMGGKKLKGSHMISRLS
ncbi:uncharacterized protein C2845_PM05G01120 [Panicum miliaceum]|uniref:No apical meristem-associated C-terminal domain-containing protein n=1 Tax=Panicum miliaceum TaxID=4540 RepID=A0A3L6T3Q5_PANMI|nr:uncharacterized protein C2845_PM05G01120 [Panicum miliaceum]